MLTIFLCLVYHCITKNSHDLLNMKNKKLIKFLKEIEKLNVKDLNVVSKLNKFQIDLLLFLKKEKKCSTGTIIKKVNKEFSRAQKYRLIEELIDYKICKKNKNYLYLNT